MSLLSVAPATPLCEIDLNVVSAYDCAFDDIAPIAAWFFEDTAYRHAAELAFERMRQQRNSLIGSLICLDRLPAAGLDTPLANAYHRAVLEIASRLLPDFRVQDTEIGGYRLCSPGEGVQRLEGTQFGMMGVLPARGFLEAELMLDDDEQLQLANERLVRSAATRPVSTFRP